MRSTSPTRLFRHKHLGREQVQDAVFLLFLTYHLREIDFPAAWFAKRFKCGLAVDPPGFPLLPFVIFVRKRAPLAGNLRKESSMPLIEDEFPIRHCRHHKATA